MTAKQGLRPEILPPCFCLLPAPEWPAEMPRERGCCCEMRLHYLPLQWGWGVEVEVGGPLGGNLQLSEVLEASQR